MKRGFLLFQGVGILFKIFEQSVKNSQGSFGIDYSLDSEKNGLRDKKLKSRNNDPEKLKQSRQEIMKD